MMITITKMIKKNEDGYDDDDNDSKPTSYGFLAAVLSPGLIMTIISLAPQWPFTRIGLSSQIFITYLAFFRLFIYSFFLYYFIIFYRSLFVHILFLLYLFSSVLFLVFFLLFIPFLRLYSFVHFNIPFIHLCLFHFFPLCLFFSYFQSYNFPGF